MLSLPKYLSSKKNLHNPPNPLEITSAKYEIDAEPAQVTLRSKNLHNLPNPREITPTKFKIYAEPVKVLLH